MKFNNKDVYISDHAKIGNNVKIGDRTVIYDNVIIGDNSVICNDCIIGEPPGAYYKNTDNFQNPETVIGANALIRSHSILYAGSQFGANLITGHRATVREGALIGDNCLLSTLVDIQGNCEIGNYCRIYSNVHISERTVLGNHVFIYPYTIFTNDPQPPSNTLLGASVGDYSVITVHCVVLPGVSVGTNCLVGANSVISRNLEDFSFAIGSPAKRLKDIRELPSREDASQSHYPWMFNFERGMPWEGIGFEAWENSKQRDTDN